MMPRMKNATFKKQKGAGTRRAMKHLVDQGRVTGVLAYLGDEPVGWCSLEPRERISILERSRILKPIDEQPVWSIICLLVRKDQRRQGLSVKMIEGAVNYARKQGARIVEAYPVEPRKNPTPDVFAYMGLRAAYQKAGFREIARRSETRPIMRRLLPPE